MPTASPSSTDAVVEAQVFWLRFQKEIAAALIILILGIVGFAGYRFYTSRRNSTAAELLGNAKNPQDYQEVIARYPGTPAGASAYLLLAEKQRSEKKFSEANATLQAFIEKYPEHDFVSTARLAMAANLESMGKNDEALSIYQEVATKYANTYNGPLALISEVPLLKAKNRIEDARRVCEELLTKYRMPGQQAEVAGDNRMETVWAGEAMRQLRSLKPPEQPKPAAATSLPVMPSGPPGAPPMIAAPTAPPSTGPVSAGAPTPKKPK
ncbi:MAG TPA: tetratricopeptide repeat protein [Chthoniobacterales bacterium]|nr:tetratricopeptide repeat protein [Chthoniobacterales bacterium]